MELGWDWHCFSLHILLCGLKPKTPGTNTWYCPVLQIGIWFIWFCTWDWLDMSCSCIFLLAFKIKLYSSMRFSVSMRILLMISSMTCAVWRGLTRCLFRRRTVQDLTLATSDLEFLRSHLEREELKMKIFQSFRFACAQPNCSFWTSASGFCICRWKNLMIYRRRQLIFWEIVMNWTGSRT